MREKVYLEKGKKISEMLKNGARLTETDEERSELSYKGQRFLVSTPYLRRLMPSDEYKERTIESLTGIGIGLAVNVGKDVSSYLSQLSQTGEENKEYSLKRRWPRKPKRKFD